MHTIENEAITAVCAATSNELENFYCTRLLRARESDSDSPTAAESADKFKGGEALSWVVSQERADHSECCDHKLETRLD